MLWSQGVISPFHVLEELVQVIPFLQDGEELRAERVDLTHLESVVSQHLQSQLLLPDGFDQVISVLLEVQGVDVVVLDDDPIHGESAESKGLEEDPLVSIIVVQEHRVHPLDDVIDVAIPDRFADCVAGGGI